MNDHIPDASKMVPWADEPTPLTQSLHDQTAPCLLPEHCYNQMIDHARNLERRCRHAEELLRRVWNNESDVVGATTLNAINAHLEAAKKEDWE